MKSDPERHSALTVILVNDLSNIVMEKLKDKECVISVLDDTMEHDNVLGDSIVFFENKFLSLYSSRIVISFMKTFQCYSCAISDCYSFEHNTASASTNLRKNNWFNPFCFLKTKTKTVPSESLGNWNDCQFWELDLIDNSVSNVTIFIMDNFSRKNIRDDFLNLIRSWNRHLSIQTNEKIVWAVITLCFLKWSLMVIGHQETLYRKRHRALALAC